MAHGGKGTQCLSFDQVHTHSIITAEWAGSARDGNFYCGPELNRGLQSGSSPVQPSSR